MPLMHCSQCNADHKQIFFSAGERQEADDTERICLGHEYSLPICIHLGLTLLQVQKIAKHQTNLRLNCGKLHPPAPGRTMCLRCVEDNQPYVSCHNDDSDKLRLKLEFATHIRCSRLASTKICPETLRQELSSVWNISATGRWKDNFGFAVADPLRAFDPNICDCVEWLSPSAQHVQWELRQDDRSWWREPAPTDGFTSLTGRCAFTRHGFTTQYEGITVDTDFLKCPADENMLIFKQTVSCAVDLKFAAGPGWGNLVTVLSYALYSDEFFEGATICPRAQCALHKLSWHSRNASIFWGQSTRDD